MMEEEYIVRHVDVFLLFPSLIIKHNSDITYPHLSLHISNVSLQKKKKKSNNGCGKRRRKEI